MDKNLKIVCLGDSITWGFPFGPDYSWTCLLEETLKAPIINKGINGNTTTEMNQRFDRDVIKHQPTHVIIMGGANDIVLAESHDRIIWNYREMVKKAQQAGINVIFGLPTPIDDDYYEKLLKKLRDWMIAFADENKFKIIDFTAAFYDEHGRLRLELLLADGAHPASAGYIEMFKQIDVSIFSSSS